ncbi:MAG: DNA-processing protein DprA [Thermotogae bacterium]|nr:DNA-processing protein DprA [Thermotogota bacterium]
MKRQDVVALNLFGDFSPDDVETLMDLGFDPLNPTRIGKIAEKKGNLEKKVRRYIERFKRERFEEELSKILNEDVEVITYWDDRYPFLLREIPNPPIILYCKGRMETLNSNRTLAIVGSRKPSFYGLNIARRFASELVELGFTIVSGMAMGIDTVSQISAVRAGGSSIGVLGTGIDVVYPKHNSNIFLEFLDRGGCLISEYPFGTSPMKQNFPRRNRIIAGISLGTLVVEAGEKSGSLITAMQALEYNRTIFAIPGPITSSLSVGTNRLTQMGAKLVMDVKDIVEEFPYIVEDRESGNGMIDLDEEEREVMEKIKEGYDDIDSLMEEMRKKYSVLISILSRLEFKGALRGEGGRYTPLI